MEIPERHLKFLKTLTAASVDAVEIDLCVLAELRSWGLATPGSLDLTGVGARLVGKGQRGVLE